MAPVPLAAVVPVATPLEPVVPAEPVKLEETEPDGVTALPVKLDETEPDGSVRIRLAFQGNASIVRLALVGGAFRIDWIINVQSRKDTYHYTDQGSLSYVEQSDGTRVEYVLDSEGKNVLDAKGNQKVSRTIERLGRVNKWFYSSSDPGASDLEKILT